MGAECSTPKPEYRQEEIHKCPSNTTMEVNCIPNIQESPQILQIPVYEESPMLQIPVYEESPPMLQIPIYEESPPILQIPVYEESPITVEGEDGLNYMDVENDLMVEGFSYQSTSYKKFLCWFLVLLLILMSIYYYLLKAD